MFHIAKINVLPQTLAVMFDIYAYWAGTPDPILAPLDDLPDGISSTA
jgi:hypothetical protein